MAYNPSIHTASNKPYGVTNKPDGARYWYYDSALFQYRPYANVAEVLAYLIANDRKGATVQVVDTEYWWPDSTNLSDAGLAIKSPNGEKILIEAGSVPTTLTVGVDFFPASTIPIVKQFQPWTYPTDDDTKLTTEGASLRTDYQYADNTLQVLLSIDVWVVDNTVDTWVRII